MKPNLQFFATMQGAGTPCPGVHVEAAEALDIETAGTASIKLASATPDTRYRFKREPSFLPFTSYSMVDITSPLSFLLVS
jgi:hypothetical protein